MPAKYTVQSEGAQLESFLDELEWERGVKEITGWDSGFACLNRALDGILPGLFLLIGPPAAGKTSLAKQLLDQVVNHNRVPAVYFTFAQTRKELRIKTLSRLTGLESREIRRGSSYLLHWYGVPKAHHAAADQLAPSWQKVKIIAEEAKSWFDLTYIVEGEAKTSLRQVEKCIDEVRTAANSEKIFVVIDDCQRLGRRDQPLAARLPALVDELQEIGLNFRIPLIAIWPNLGEISESHPEGWADLVASPDVILVLERDQEKSKTLTDTKQTMILHIIKNRRGEKGKLTFDFLPAFSKFVEVGT
jgi:hypothetical protein